MHPLCRLDFTFSYFSQLFLASLASGAAPNPSYVLGADVEVRSQAGGDIGERIEILLRGVDQLYHCGALIRVHAHKPRRDGKLNHAGLGAYERGDEAGRVHDAELRWLP